MNSRIAARPLIVVVMLVLSLVATAIGYWVGSRVRSPQEAVANTKPPSLTQMTAPVRRGALEVVEGFTGVVTWKSKHGVDIVQGAGGGRQVVTRIPLAAGVRFGSGTVLLEVSDRPLIVLEGAVPMLRDLRLGDRGADVGRLQVALRAAGHYVGAIDAHYGQLTADAVRDLYQTAGYAVPLRKPRPGGLGANGVAPVALMSELAFVPSLPATLLAYPVQLGDDVQSTAASVGVGGLQISAKLPADWAPALRGGRRGVTLTAEVDGGRQVRVEARHVGQPTVVDGERVVTALLAPIAGPMPTSWAGSDAEVTVRDRSGPVGLKVPLSALFVSASLGDFVRVERASGALEAVPVEVLDTGEGVAIVDSTTLRVRDRVAVGRASQ